MSGAAEPSRVARAMAALDQQLVRRPEGLILLLTPPFDHTPHDPGYIKDYVPASVKMAVNTPMPPHGRSSPLPRSATATRPANYSGC